MKSVSGGMACQLDVVNSSKGVQHVKSSILRAMDKPSRATNTRQATPKPPGVSQQTGFKQDQNHDQ